MIISGPNLDGIRAAQAWLAQRLPRTRLVRAARLSHPAAELLLKLECELPTGSFKPRGALVALDARLKAGPVAGIVASSTGNHGAAVAYAARVFGLPAHIFLPLSPNPVKRANIAAQGAEIHESGADLAAAWAAADAFASDHGYYFLNDATDPHVPLGTATIACELLEARPDLEAIFAPMGDTALIRGVAAAAKQISPGIRIIGVQAEMAPSYYLSWQAGRAVPTPTCATCADGLATRTPMPENVTAIRALVDEVRLVSEDAMLGAARRLRLEEGVVAEPSGAAATAAWLADSTPARSSAALVTGGNVTEEISRQTN